MTTLRQSDAEAEIDEQDYALPPTDDVKYSNFAVRRRWPLLWLAAAQFALMAGFVAVMISSTVSLAGLALLAVMVPFAWLTLSLALSRPGHDIERHVVFVESWRKKRTDLPAVDVVITWANESDHEFENLALAVHDLQWSGRLRVHLIDAAGFPSRLADAQAHGFTLWRPDASLGERNRGFALRVLDTLTGDLVLHLRPGSVPRPDFLWETVPSLQDPRVGAVHAAESADLHRASSAHRATSAVRDVFHRWVQPVRDRQGVATSGRSAVLYRRSVLRADPTPEAETLSHGPRWDVSLHARGYQTRHVPVVLSTVIAPSAWRDVIAEQYQLATERAELALTRAIAHARLTRRQRGHYRRALLCYVASAAAPAAVALPVLVMLWLHPGSVHAEEYWPALPAIAALLFIVPALTRAYRPSIARHFAVYSVTHLIALTDAVVAWVLSVGGRRSLGWLPGDASAVRRVGVVGTMLLVATQTLLWTGVVHAASTPQIVLLDLWPVAVLGLGQAAVLAPLFGGLLVSESRHNRRARQTPVAAAESASARDELGRAA